MMKTKKKHEKTNSQCSWLHCGQINRAKNPKITFIYTSCVRRGTHSIIWALIFFSAQHMSSPLLFTLPLQHVIKRFNTRFILKPLIASCFLFSVVQNQLFAHRSFQNCSVRRPIRRQLFEYPKRVGISDIKDIHLIVHQPSLRGSLIVNDF